MKRQVYFVGSPHEVAHHAAPIAEDPALVTEVIAATEVVAIANRGDVVVFFSEHFDRFRQAIVELKEKQIPTIYLVDGILEWRNAWENRPDEPACPFTMRPVLCDKVAVIGRSQARVLASWGNGGKIEQVGIPRLDTLAERWRADSSVDTSDHETAPASLAGDKPFRVLVTTAKTPGFTAEQIETTAMSLLDLKSWFERNASVDGRSIEVTWRLTAGLEDRLAVENHLTGLDGRELHKQMADCDALITTPSTAMLEGMLCGKPVALLNYHPFPVYVPAAWSIRSSQALDAVMNQLLHPSQSRQHLQQAILADTLQVAESASARLIQLIHSMLASADEQSAAGESLEFPSNLLSAAEFGTNLVDRACKLDPAAVFEDFNAFVDDADEPSLRAQLAHARREIDHLKHIQDGLKAELAEAHSIFEQIQQHPIAGPIVRIRERFLKFTERREKDS